MSQTSFQSARLLRPASAFYIYFTLFVALLANMAPTNQATYVPDWLAMVICFWGIREYRKVGMGLAFAFGIAMDVADASVMGQHALSYVLTAYFASTFSRRILWFGLLEQALHVLPILLLAQVVQFVVRMIGGGDFPGFGFFVGPLFATLLWVPAFYVLMLPQFRPEDRDDNRPI